MKTILITGSSGGIGKELVKVFSSAGYQVIGIDKRKINYKNYTHINLDLEKFTELNKSEQKKLVRKINMVTNFDGINILINNAAMQIMKDIMSLTNQYFLKSFKINALAPFNLTKLFFDDLVKKPEVMIHAVNARFNTSYKVSENMAKAATTILGQKKAANVVAVPSKERETCKIISKKRVELESKSRWASRAMDIYQQIVDEEIRADEYKLVA